MERHGKKWEWGGEVIPEGDVAELVHY